MAKLYFEVNGGLGNQLFTVASAFAFAKKYKIQIVLDTRGCDSGNNLHSSWQLEDLVKVLANNLEIDVRRSNTQTKKILRKLCDQVLNLKYIKKKDIEAFYKDGFDSNENHFLPFFESRTLVEDALKFGFTREIDRLKKVIGIENLYLPCTDKCVGLHIRRTDKKNSEYEIPDVWFLQQLEKISMEIKHVVCFTDSALDSEFIFRSGITTKIYGEETSPLIALLSLSEFPTLITSNSTFSFWATALRSSGNIISPLGPHNEIRPLIPYKHMPA
jgi:hypothetical protein